MDVDALVIDDDIMPRPTPTRSYDTPPDNCPLAAVQGLAAAASGDAAQLTTKGPEPPTPQATQGHAGPQQPSDRLAAAPAGQPSPDAHVPMSAAGPFSGSCRANPQHASQQSNKFGAASPSGASIMILQCRPAYQRSEVRQHHPRASPLSRANTVC